jgi:hypothetical protein
MPLTEFQSKVAQLLATQRSPDSYLAGGAAMHIEPMSKRYSNDLDYFQDSEERVASAFENDQQALEAAACKVEVSMRQPGFVRAIVSKGSESTKVEWAHDTAWRFMPPLEHPLAGFVLHPVDLAINKLLALVGRDEPRDFLDIMHVHEEVLSLGALCWAAAGKDPGFTPTLLLSLLKRRGRYHTEDFARLRLTEAPDLGELKLKWLGALEQAEAFVQKRPPSELGCLYYSLREQRFVSDFDAGDPAVVPHYGRPGGLLPSVSSQ